MKKFYGWKKICVHGSSFFDNVKDRKFWVQAQVNKYAPKVEKFCNKLRSVTHVFFPPAWPPSKKYISVIRDRSWHFSLTWERRKLNSWMNWFNTTHPLLKPINFTPPLSKFNGSDSLVSTLVNATGKVSYYFLLWETKMKKGREWVSVLIIWTYRDWTLSGQTNYSITAPGVLMRNYRAEKKVHRISLMVRNYRNNWIFHHRIYNKKLNIRETCMTQWIQ